MMKQIAYIIIFLLACIGAISCVETIVMDPQEKKLAETHHPQELNLGIYNVLNRHNPFSIIYDDRSREWRQVSLLPIMPSFNWRMEF